VVLWTKKGLGSVPATATGRNQRKDLAMPSELPPVLVLCRYLTERLVAPHSCCPRLGGLQFLRYQEKGYIVKCDGSSRTVCWAGDLYSLWLKRPSTRQMILVWWHEHSPLPCRISRGGRWDFYWVTAELHDNLCSIGEDHKHHKLFYLQYLHHQRNAAPVSLLIWNCVRAHRHVTAFEP
jgi:hypothetical protein